METAVAETAFYKVLFFLVEARGMALPANAVDHHAFTVPCAARRGIDLTELPYADDANLTALADDTACQALADAARAAEVDVIRYRSVRDPAGGMNVALVTPAAFRATEPKALQTWSFFVRSDRVQARREFPPQDIEHPMTDFATDPRL